jgi:ketosteroid isomerase-like protein
MQRVGVGQRAVNVEQQCLPRSILHFSISLCEQTFIASYGRFRNRLFTEPGYAPRRSVTSRSRCSTAAGITAKLAAQPEPWRKPMTIDRRQLTLPVLAVGLLGAVPVSTVPVLAASAEEEAVAEKVEAFRTAQIADDAKALDALCAAELSYSHSSGVVEDKATFIANATNGKTKFLSVEYRDPSIRVVGPAAIVRFHWVAEQEATTDGKKSSTNLHILMNWQKQGADWKLLSRSATKL